MKNISASNEEKSVNDLLAVLAMITVVLSLSSFAITYYKVTQLKQNLITGFVSSTAGYVNFTIYTNIQINVTNQSINFGEVSINSSGGFYNATYSTNGDTGGNVSCRGWSGAGTPCGNFSGTAAETKAFVIENIGSINCSLIVGAESSVGSMFGTDANNQEFLFKVDDKEVGSCTATTKASNFTTWNYINGSMRICNNFGFVPAKNALYMDVRVTVPYDVNISGGGLTPRSNTFTFTASTYI